MARSRVIEQGVGLEGRPPASPCRRRFNFGLIGLIASIGTPLPRASRAAQLPAPQASIARKFKLFWHDYLIGSHEFSVTPTGMPGDYDVAVEIDIGFDLGWFGDLNYRHSCRESWRGGRLMTLDSYTNDDGEVFAVTGAAAGDRFRMTGPSGPFEAPGGLLTSASFWSERVCEESQIIDASAGTIIGLVATQAGTAYALSSGQVHLARIYQVISPIIAGNFWYDQHGIWVKGRLERSGVEVEYVLPA